MSIPAELRIKEYDQAVELLDDLRRRLDLGEIMSILAVVECADGGMSGSCTATQNVYALYGYALSWAMARMGFLHSEELKKSGEEEEH